MMPMMRRICLMFAVGVAPFLTAMAVAAGSAEAGATKATRKARHAGYISRLYVRTDQAKTSCWAVVSELTIRREL